MRELAVAGFVAVAFGLGSFYATDHFGTFSAVNLGLGSAALVLAGAVSARRLRVVGGPHSRPVLLRGLALVAVAVVAAVALERAADHADVRFDWTFEGRYEPAPATVKALEELCGPVEILLFYDPLDPRIRRTRLLVDTLARHGDVSVRELSIEEVPEEIDVYGVGTSNSLVIRLGSRFELAERPTEGAVYEALYRLCSRQGGVIVALRGEGEGDVERESPVGYAGLATALATEGYEVRSRVTAALGEVPEDVDAVLAIAPERRLHPTGLAALARFLERGGRLIALLEPDRESGLEGLLAGWGITPLRAVVLDPASDALGSEASGTGIVAYNYETHPIARGLDRNRMTFFPGAGSFRLRKPTIEDELVGVVLSSPRAWLSEDLSLLSRRSAAPEPPEGVRGDYHPIAVAARYPREGRETRIFVAGDADFASNEHLRTLYNLDLVLNGVHWALEREPAITLRPKIRDTVQFPLPVTDSLQTLYGVGLLIPELLLMTGGVVWVRRRAA